MDYTHRTQIYPENEYPRTEEVVVLCTLYQSVLGYNTLGRAPCRGVRYDNRLPYVCAMSLVRVCLTDPSDRIFQVKTFFLSVSTGLVVSTGPKCTIILGSKKSIALRHLWSEGLSVSERLTIRVGDPSTSSDGCFWFDDNRTGRNARWKRLGWCVSQNYS